KLREIENINIVDFTKSNQQKTADSNDNTDIKRKTRSVKKIKISRK
ncbi:9171_t:CDS:1, partial [Entrophospora sp. SA101]